MCNTSFCPNCGYRKPVQLAEQVEKLSKSVSRLKKFCIILSIAIVLLVIVFAFVYHSVWENVVDLWENVEDLWDNAEELWDSSEELWNGRSYWYY